MHRRASSVRLGGPIGVSVVLHASLIAAAIVARPAKPAALPPVYQVKLYAAPPGERAIGEVRPEPKAPTPPPETPAAPPKRAETNPRDMPAPEKKRTTARKPAAPATPTPEAKSTPKNTTPTVAGGGPTGGTGTDVANVQIEGVQFSDPAYVNNIVRQIALRFKPRNPGALKAQVFFIIKRDGSVGEIRFMTKSNVFAFDLEAQGAVESAGSAKAFGRLPDSYTNDFLPVIFSFDPSVIR